MKHVFESHGVSIEVDYIIAPDRAVEFQSAHLVGSDYAPVGPDIMGLLHNLVVVTATTADGNEGVRVLELIHEEIEDERSRH